MSGRFRTVYTFADGTTADTFLRSKAEAIRAARAVLAGPQPDPPLVEARVVRADGTVVWRATPPIGLP